MIVPGKVLRRDYQVSVAVECTKRNTLVIIPTGLGKTVIALLVMAARVTEQPGKVLFLAPTKPLVEQHAAFLGDTFLHPPITVFTGETSPADREIDWRTSNVICSTPQVIQNDLIAGRIDLKDVTCVVFDESHRAVGNYAYGFIAERYREDRATGLTLAMTASPGAKADKIREVCERLFVEGVEARNEYDSDVEKYVQDVKVEPIQVTVPESLRKPADIVKTLLEEHIRDLRAFDVYKGPYASRKELLACQARLQAKLRQGGDSSATYAALSLQAGALKLAHALELVETQGLAAFQTYVERLRDDESKAARALLADHRFQHALDLAERTNVEHPKLRKVAVLLRQEFAARPESRVIVFTNYRDTAELLERELAKVDGLRPKRFVGQATRSATDKGLSQKQQVAIVEEFKQGLHNVLIATSVAEEGLDIPSTDLVIFYEPVASEIRTIQRRGRTGRKHAGRVIVLITKGTRDEVYNFASRGKERRMRTEIESLKSHFSAVNASERTNEGATWFQSRAGAYSGKEATLDAFPETEAPREDAGEAQAGAASGQGVVAGAAPSGPGSGKGLTIICDSREFASGVVRELARMGIIVEPKSLAVGDYILSDRVAVERKDVADYTKSLFDGRLFTQVKELRSNYSVPLLVVEGGSPGEATRANSASIYGSLASIATDFRTPILMTNSPEETARLLAAIAAREQRDANRPVAARADKGAKTREERLRFLVEGLPHVSAVLSDRLLTHFNTLKAIADAGEDDLMEVQGVGRKLAREIHTFFRTEYQVTRPTRGGKGRSKDSDAGDRGNAGNGGHPGPAGGEASS